jgi:spore maturation protein CgeB
MKWVLFCHAFTSCWNNGNAHFLRGIARELLALNHEVTVYEPADGWSRSNALRDGVTIATPDELVPGVDVRQYLYPIGLEEALDDADAVLVHEWNSPELVAAIGKRRAHGGAFTLLFHDTHHRAVSAPHELDRFDLDGFDAVLAFGEVLRDIYLRRGWARQAVTWHEAADTALYQPRAECEPEHDLVWIGNWGDDERSAEIVTYLVEPAKALGLSGAVYGVRYPEAATRAIADSGLAYRGWLANHLAPPAFAKGRMTVHIPRGPYARMLPGIPTIRMFEALACGIPLVSAPWLDEERLFPAGAYLSVANGPGMKAAMLVLLQDRDLAMSLAATGLKAIRDRHTCRHRALELLAIVDALRAEPRVFDREIHATEIAS